MKWRKGVSGNPSGRPRKGKTLTEALERHENREELAKVVWELAVKDKDMAAIGLIFKYLAPIENAVTLRLGAADERRELDFSKLSASELTALAGLLDRARQPGEDTGERGALPALLAPIPGGSVADS